MIAGANEVDLLTLPRDLLSLRGSMPVEPGGGRAAKWNGWRKPPALAPARLSHKRPPRRQRGVCRSVLEPGGALDAVPQRLNRTAVTDPTAPRSRQEKARECLRRLQVRLRKATSESAEQPKLPADTHKCAAL